MKLIEAINKISLIKINRLNEKVNETVAEELQKEIKDAKIIHTDDLQAKTDKGTFYISTGGQIVFSNFNYNEVSEKYPDGFIYFKITEDGSGFLVSSKTNLLYSAFCYIIEEYLSEDIDKFKNGIIINPSFVCQRISYDYFLTQSGRTQKSFDRTQYIKYCARIGVTHVEVNGLAYPMGIEEGVKGETYQMFYTYCPALDQFVYSELNKGIYPYYYLSANLGYLKDNAALAVKYGLTPGLLCFEPRNVPEQLLEKYPMLRGCRVDHPFRSFKPRYNLTITHPRVLEHYAEMMSKLMSEVPQLGFMSVWTNDSGAGYEHTKSLYVGRNGGAYLIREWKNDEEIARLAGENILRFLRTLRDAAAKTNPDFRVVTRLESFYGEHETVWAGLGNKIDVETNTLLARGWDMPYAHPKYPEIKDVAGTLYHNYLDPKEKLVMNELESKGGEVHYMFSQGLMNMFESLIGIPFPWQTYKKLKSMKEVGVRYNLSAGGFNPPDLVPYAVNHEIFRKFFFNPDLNIDEVVKDIAEKWAGAHYPELIEAWKYIEDAILAYPIPNMMHSNFGFTWYRLWCRPLVPNIEAIPESERAYYENFMCTTPHNPQNVDLAKDVLFELTTQERCELADKRYKEYLWEPMNKALKILQQNFNAIPENDKAKQVFYDQYIRARALKCWLKTIQSSAEWVAGVHGYIKSDDKSKKAEYKKMVQAMIKEEIENAKDFIELFTTSKIEFMAVSKEGETPLIYGKNLPELVKKKILLMEKHIDDEPFIDPDYMLKRAAMPVI
jgi:hypothetical protein